MSVLVTGGAGYIGSHVVHRLRAAGRGPVVIDSLVTGHRDAVPGDVPFLLADVADRARVANSSSATGVRAVLHFAALSQVGESVAAPRRYFQGNTVATLSLLESVLDAGVPAFVLSSTAAVYGIPEHTPIPETHPTRPISPYGETKLSIEQLRSPRTTSAYGLRYAALRYFNAAGAEASAGLGERHEPESHIIPLVLRVALGSGPTSPSTATTTTPPTAPACATTSTSATSPTPTSRPSITSSAGASGAFNLGTGRGYSVREVVLAARRVTGHPIPVVHGPRRPGDPPVLVASPRLAEESFGFRARRSAIDEIVRDAWDFHRAFAARDGDPR
jgi:UDP-glucose 4-epimerase